MPWARGPARDVRARPGCSSGSWRRWHGSSTVAGPGASVIVAPGWMPAPAGAADLRAVCRSVATAASPGFAAPALIGSAAPPALSSRRSMATATYVYCLVQSARKPSVARVPAALPGATPAVPAQLAERLWVVHADGAARSLRPRTAGGVAAGSRMGVAIAVGTRSRRRALRGVARSDGHPDEAVHDVLQPRARACRDARAARRLKRRCSRVSKAARNGACGSCASDAADASDGSRQAVDRRRVPRREETGARRRADGDLAAAARQPMPRTRSSRRSRRIIAAARAKRRALLPPLLDAAFLVPARRRARFRRRPQKVARQVTETGAQMTLTGPWPAYNFVGSLEEPA